MLKSEKWLIPANLALFDETGENAGTTEVTATTGTSQAESGDSVVVYGKEAENQTTPDLEETKPAEKPPVKLSAEDKEKAYNELIKGDFKDLFEKHTQKIINERFKPAKQIEARLDEIQPIIDLLMSHYGAKSITDLNAMLQNELIPDMAEAAGMTPEAYRRQVELEQEVDRLKRAQEEQSMQERVKDWFTQAESLRGTQDKPGKYPGFDLQQASDHPKYGANFLKLLESGISVEAAYIAAFHDELVDRARVETAKKAENATLEAIKAGGMRPPEIGAKRQSGIVRKSSVYELSAEDRAEIARKAARGEKIRF